MDPKALPPISTAATFNKVSEERGWGCQLKAIDDDPYKWEMIDTDGLRRFQAAREKDAVAFARLILERAE